MVLYIPGGAGFLPSTVAPKRQAFGWFEPTIKDNLNLKQLWCVLDVQTLSFREGVLMINLFFHNQMHVPVTISQSNIVSH